MEIRYKKVSIMYAVLALACIMMAKILVIKPVAQLIEVHSLQKQVKKAENNAEEGKLRVEGTALTGKAEVQDFLLAALGCISESDCSVISGTPSRKKTPDTCPVYNLDIVFSGSYSEMLKSLSAIDSLAAAVEFEAAVASCHIGAERSSDGRNWSLVCRETLQCLPTMASKTKWMASHPAGSVCEYPFYIPLAMVEKSEEDNTTPQVHSHSAKKMPQGRLVGHIGNGRDIITIIEINGESLQLHRGDDVLLKDFGDSVKIAWNTDTLIVRSNDKP